MANYINLSLTILALYYLVRNKDKINLFGGAGGSPPPSTSSNNRKSTGNTMPSPSPSSSSSSGSGGKGKGKGSSSGTGGSKGKVSKRGKTRVMVNPKVKLIFWGNFANANPSAAQIETAYKNLINSNYYDSLTQYGPAKPTFIGSVKDPSTPPNPFSDAQIQAVVSRVGSADPDVINCVVVPAGTKSTDKVGDAWHDVFGGKTIAVYYGANNLTAMMRAMSEEIAESATDPYQTASGDQIGDLCENVFTVNGVTVEGYWSNKDNKCTTGTAGASAKAAFISSNTRLLKRKALRASMYYY